MRLPDALLAAADQVAAATGLLARTFQADTLVATAGRRSGAAPIEPAVREGLEHFLAACDAEADLGLLGRSATKWDAVRLLGNLFRFHREEQADPSLLQQPIERPIFITGLPRSGTSFLHRLLMQDPANQVPRFWQAMSPYPPEKGDDRRIHEVDRQLRIFEVLAPEFRSLHPVDAQSPQECSEINAHVFATLRFDTNYNIPSYRRWLDAHGHLDAYRFHRRFLQHLQRQSTPVAGRRWVLKCPDHVFALRDLLAVYPNAGLVFVHRDPLKVLPSNTRLTEVLRRPFTRRIDPHALARQESDRWQLGTARMIEAEQGRLGARPIFHVHHRALTAQPLATVQAIYRHFDLEPNAGAETAIARLVAAQPNGGYGRNRYDLAAYGIDVAEERERFRRYTEYFDVEAEALAA